MDLRPTLAVAVGGAAGASLRWAISESLDGDSALPWGVLVANIAGCLLLGLLVGRGGIATFATHLELAAAVGFCGALTTFSTFAVDLARYLDEGRVARAAVYLAMSAIGGVAAFVVGRSVAGKPKAAAR